VDWSYTHVIYSKDRSPDEEAAKPNDKRYIYSRKLHSNVRAAASVDPSRLEGDGKDERFAVGRFDQNRGQTPAKPAKIDWSFSLGVGFVAPGMYPAKFSFDINAPVTASNCTGNNGQGMPDYVVYGLDVAGVSNGQSNLLGLDNLYTGTSPAGICTGSGPSVLFSYDTTTVSGGKITTSPTLSEDGTQIAFLESGGAVSFLHILNWNAGDGAGSNDALHAAVPSTISGNAYATAAVSDTVSGITLTNGGSGYTTAPTVTVSGGGGTGATATSTINGGVATVAVTAQGSNYASAPVVTFSNPVGQGGTAATGTANVTNGVTSYTVTAGGSGYTSAPAVTVTPGPATATSSITQGVTSINVTNGGSGYNTAPIVVYSTGAGAATANLSQGVGSYTVTSNGSGYTSAPTVTLTGGGGSGAAGTATFSGSVQSVNLTNAGSAYQSAPTVVFTGAGSGAAATATIAGPVSTLTLTTGGTGYTSAPTVSITGGGGTGATATANMSTITSVSGVTFTNTGSYNTDFGNYNPVVTFSCTSATTCTQNIQATGTVTTSTTDPPCSATQGSVYFFPFGYSQDVCIASVAISNAGSYTLTAGGSITMTISGYYSKVTAAAFTVNTSTSQTVSSLSLTSGGSGYTSNPSVSFSSGAAAATAKINATVQAVNLTNGGSYTSAPTVSFTGGSGTGAAATVTFSGSVTGLTETAIGTGYTSAPTVGFTGGGAGSGAAANANLTGVVGSITVTNPGTYTSTPTITFNNTGTGGNAAAATAVRSDYVSAVNVTNAGNNYLTPPTVSFSGGSGSGAAAIANLSGVVSSVSITSAGSGYTTAPTVSFANTGTGGTGAAATCTINGSVVAVNLTNAGTGYTGTPTVAFGSGGGGTGAAATATTQDQLSGITVVYGGSGYSNTSVPNIYITGGGSGASGATATANVSAGGVVTSITLTSNGTGYTAAPTVTVGPPLNTCTGSGSCMINVPISGDKITNSSPYYDYDNDVLYFGDDNGVLYSVSPVFVGTATTGGTATPVVTSLQVATTTGQTMLTGPVLDGSSGNVFVGAADGKVYAVATPLTSVTASMAVGQGTGTCGSAFGSTYYSAGGLTDPVIVDGSISALYAYSQNAASSISSANRAVVTQAFTGGNSTTLFGSPVNNLVTGLGASCGTNPASSSSFLASQVNVHAPAFDNNYYNGTGVGHLFICNNSPSSSTSPEMYAITFNSGVMQNATDSTLALSLSTVATSTYSECAPITEIFQPGTDGGPDGTDIMLLGVGRTSGASGATGAAIGQQYPVTNSYTMTKGINHYVNTYPAAQDGISGIVVDNISSAAQASSMYFTTEAIGTSSDPVCGVGKFCAVKLTQSGLQ
jgi:hypothetical protein